MSAAPRVVQRTPDLGIKIKLQRLPVVALQSAPVAPPAPEPPPPVEPPVEPPVPAGRAPKVALFAEAPLMAWWADAIAIGGGTFDTWRWTGGYVDIQHGSEVELRAVVFYYAGEEVEWSWDFQYPDVDGYAMNEHWDGVDLLVDDGTLRIRILPGNYYGYLQNPIYATLVVTAKLDGVGIGSIEIRPRFNP